MDFLSELTAVMEEEIRVGERLLGNLADQKKAIISWNSSDLLRRVEEKETLIQGLGVMEESRRSIMAHLLRRETNLSLRDLLGQLSPGPLATKLESLKQEAREIYTRLRAEEKGVVTLLQLLVGHLREALGTLSDFTANLYEQGGNPASPPRVSRLVQTKI